MYVYIYVLYGRSGYCVCLFHTFQMRFIDPRTVNCRAPKQWTQLNYYDVAMASDPAQVRAQAQAHNKCDDNRQQQQ